MGTITKADLQQRYEEARTSAKSELAFYADGRIIGYFLASILLRVLTMLLIVAGAVLPFMQIDLSKAFFPFSHPAQAAVACFAVAGVLIAANQVFMVSVTWTRYVDAKMKIQSLIQAAEWDWKIFLDTMADPMGVDDLRRGSEICKSLVLSTRRVVEAETAAWATEVSRAVDQLQALVKEQRSAAQELALKQDQARHAAEKAAAVVTTGAIKVKLDGSANRFVPSPSITVGAAGKAVWKGGPIVITDVPVGINKIVVSGNTVDGAELALEGAVLVSPGTISEVSISVPPV